MITDDVRKLHTNKVYKDVFLSRLHIQSQPCDQDSRCVRLSLRLRLLPRLLVVQHIPTILAVQVQMLLTTVCLLIAAYDSNSNRLQMSSLAEVPLALLWQLVLLKMEYIL
jgi:hypothetical protein